MDPVSKPTPSPSASTPSSTPASTPPTTPASTPPAASTPVSLVNPDGTYASDWLDRLTVDEEVKGDQQLRTHKSLADTAKNIHELMKLRGHHVVPIPPEGNQDPKLWDEVYKRLGRPDKPEGYTMPKLEGVPEDRRMPKETLSEITNLMHLAGVSDRQWQTISDGWNKIVAKGLEAQQQQAALALNPLRETWGGQFDANVALVEKFLRSQVPPERFEAAVGSLKTQPDVLRLLFEAAKTHVEGEPDLSGTPGSVLAAAETEIAKLTRGDAQSPYHNRYHPEHDAVIKRVDELRRIVAAGKPKPQANQQSLELSVT